MLPLLLAACAGAPDTDSPGSPDSPGDDSGVDSAPAKLDTGLALVYLEGHGDTLGDQWSGSESQVATSYDGAIAFCRITNPTHGAPSAQRCDNCLYAFDLTFDPGTAEGDACANLYFTADMLDGTTLSYGFATSWVGEDGYAWENVLLYTDDSADVSSWVPWAYAEFDSGEQKTDYEGIYAYTTYYYYL